VETFNEYKITGIEKTIGSGSSFGIHDYPFEIHEDQDSLTVQRRRSYLMEVNEDFDIQQVFKEISWQNQRE
jgi:hypothetical protein